LTDPEGARSSIGSLLLAYYTDGGKLICAGRVGPGMCDRAQRLAEKAEPARREVLTRER
jgi:ATP-dependent DNA ligase